MIRLTRVPRMKEAPLIVVVFRSRLDPDLPEGEFETLSAEMYELCSKLPGFVSERSYTAEDGERLTLVEFESEESLEAWRRHPEHNAAQRKGRERYYTAYSSQVCKELRRSEFERGEMKGARR